MHQIANDQIEQRLTELRTEYASGQTMLADTETSLGNMRSSLLRIAGAIQVMEELMGQEETTNSRGMEAATDGSPTGPEESESHALDAGEHHE